jgi:hypothetical protein
MKHNTFQSFLSFLNSETEHGNRIAPIVWGSTGVGKTQAVERFARSIQAECVVLHLASQDPGDLLGLPTRDEENGMTKWLRPEWMPREDDPGKYVIFLDEFNRANKYVLDVMLPFLLDGTLGTHKVPTNTFIVAAANPGGTEEYNVTDIDDRAMLSRLCHVTLDASFSDWASHVGDDVHPAMIEATREIVSFGKCDMPIDVKPDPRSMHLSGIALKHLSEDDYLSFGWEFLYGMIGNTASAVTAYIDSEGLSQGVGVESILRTYSDVRPAVLSAMDDPDAANRMSNSVLDKLYEMKTISDKEKSNVVAFLMDLQEDVFMGFMSRIGRSGQDDRERNKSMIISCYVSTKEVIQKLQDCGSKGVQAND